MCKLCPEWGVIIVEATQELFTPTEAAALTGVEVTVVRKEIEKRVIRPKRVARQHPHVRVALADLFYLQVLRDFDLELPARVRMRIRNAIAHHWGLADRPGELVISGLLTLKIGEAESVVLALLQRFDDWRKRLVQDPGILGGEAVFPGSRLAVRHVGGVLERGEAPKSIREDYPYLTDEDLEFARLYVKAYPNVGRPKSRQAAA